MELQITEYFDLNTFEAWGGAMFRLEEIKELGITDEAQEYIEEMFADANVVTPTDINDVLWFEMDDFISNFTDEEDEED